MSLKKTSLLFLFFLMFCFPRSLFAVGIDPGKNSKKDDPESQIYPAVSAEGAILMDAGSGQILYSKNPEKELFPASTTKILTAILVLEHGHLNQITTISKKVSETPYTSIHLKEGEKISVDELLHGALMRSANDACMGLAEAVAGSDTAFVKKMNERARQLGAKHTHFVTCNGLHDPNHYTCAEDLGIFTRKAIQFPEFNKIVSTKKWVLTRSKNQDDRVVYNRNHFIWRVKGADGIKTGYTKQAGKCLVASISRGGWRLIAIVLHSKDPIGESSSLIDYGYLNYRRIVLERKGESLGTVKVRLGHDAKVPVVAAKDLDIVLSRRLKEKPLRMAIISPITAPIAVHTRVGTLYAVADGRKIASVPVVTAKAVGRSRVIYLLYSVLCFGIVMALCGIIKFYGRKTAKNHFSGRNRFSA